MRKIAILIISAFFFLSCKQKTPIKPTFYFWRTDYHNKNAETNYLTKFRSKSLYVRIMDVDFNPDLQQPVPISPIKFSDPLPKNVDIVPVVFLVNNLFAQLDTPNIDLLAKRVVNFVDGKVKQAGKRDFAELQIDCDWTKTTRDKYFTFLKRLQAQPKLKNKSVTVTLRLHQIKNIISSGIPPVKKGILMCYNMGNLKKYGNQNSILDQHELEVYLKDRLEYYPLKLDVALPIFEWAVVFRDNQYAGISKGLNKTLLLDQNFFKPKGNSNLYNLLKDYPQVALKKGDIIRWEEISTADLLATSSFLSRYLKPEERNLVFYHLDTELLKHFTNEDFEKIITNF